MSIEILDIPTPAGTKAVEVLDTYRLQVRFPRSKKKRIQKKWARRPENFVSTQERTYYLFDERAVMNMIYGSLSMPPRFLDEPERPWRCSLMASALLFRHELAPWPLARITT